MQKITILAAFVFACSIVYGQREMGSWQDYLSYANAKKVALSSEKIYCVTEGGLFYYNLQDNSINKLSGNVPLSDFGVETIAFSQEHNILIVAYHNSNIDLIYENGNVINLTDIKRKQITGDKTIYNISFIDGETYLSCGFGIVVLNLERQEIKDTYFIGENGGTIRVNDVESDGQFIYAATNEGILKADKNSPNLLDYQNWGKIENIPNADQKFSHLAFHGGNLIANYTPDEYNSDKMYILEEGSWSPYNPQINFAYDVQVTGGFMSVCCRGEVYVVDQQHAIAKMVNMYKTSGEEIFPIKPRSSIVSPDGTIWIADYENSLIQVNGESFEISSPIGPFDNFVFSLNHTGSDLWVAPGGKSGWEVPRFQRFRDGKWNYFKKNNHPELDEFFNILSVEVNPADENHFFVSSWGGGLLEYKNDELVQRYTNFNSPLETALPQEPEAPYVRIGGIDFDSDGNLWITNSEVADNLLRLSPDGNWESFALPEVANKRSIGEVLVTQNNDKWILVPRGHDAYVVNESGNEVKRLLVTSYFNNGENEIFNRMNDVYSIAEDKEGAIWIGTSKGVAVYNNPQRIWDGGTFYATQPSLDLGDGLYHPLLETETVTAIAVDGANRKWLGTSNSGVYLLSESGENEILHFTTNNSPLLSNEITALAINESTGEVFFGTDEGLISYQGDAIEGKNSFENVYVYPNPVRETYDGPVTITGLMEETDIKITDISGNLVYKTTSLGGKAVWDGKNLNGNRVRTGVYLVFCNDKTGEETHIAKLLFIN